MKKLLTILSMVSLLTVTWTSFAGAVAINCNTAGACGDLTLATLEANKDGFIIGDKQFFNFSGVINGFPAGQFFPNTEAGVAIDPFTQNGGQLEGFTIGGILGVVGPAQASWDLALRYDVKTVSGANLISDYHLSIGGFGIKNGTGSISVDETFRDTNNHFLGGLTVDNSSPSATSDSIVFGSLFNELHVTKDIGVILLTGGTNARATISVIDQAVSQGTAVPEPSSLLLLGSGLVGLGLLRRKRNS